MGALKDKGLLEWNKAIGVKIHIAKSRSWISAEGKQTGYAPPSMPLIWYAVPVRINPY